jgi:hypothetical protein
MGLFSNHVRTVSGGTLGVLGLFSSSALGQNNPGILDHDRLPAIQSREKPRETETELPKLVPRGPDFRLEVTLAKAANPTPLRSGPVLVRPEHDQDTPPSPTVEIVWTSETETRGWICIHSLDQYARGLARSASPAERSFTENAWNAPEGEQQAAFRWLVDFVLNQRLTPTLQLLPEASSLKVAIFNRSDLEVLIQGEPVFEPQAANMDPLIFNSSSCHRYTSLVALSSPLIEEEGPDAVPGLPRLQQLVIAFELATPFQLSGDQVQAIERSLSSEITALRSFVSELKFFESGANYASSPKIAARVLTQAREALWPPQSAASSDPRATTPERISQAPAEGRPLYPGLVSQIDSLISWYRDKGDSELGQDPKQRDFKAP